MNTNYLQFKGKGLAYFKIHFVNTLLRILSLSLLHPWAKVREINYVCNTLSLGGTSFEFTGTTKAFFNGYIKTFFVFVLLFSLCFFGGLTAGHYRETMLGPVIYTLFVFGYTLGIYFVCPIVLHGSLSYRLNNALWKNISPSYVGKLSALTPLCFSGMVLTLLSAGIYEAWFRVKLTRYLLQHVRFGNLRFDFSGSPQKLFLIYLKGISLSILTLGIYSIWFVKQVYDYHVNNIVVKKDDQEFNLHSDANPLDAFEMVIGNILLVVFTLGIGISWAYMRYYRFLINHCIIPADFNLDTITPYQEEENHPKKSGKGKTDKWNPIWIV